MCGSRLCAAYLTASPCPHQLTEEQRRVQREQLADAAEARSKNFQQGGGGAKTKAKSQAAERVNDSGAAPARMYD